MKRILLPTDFSIDSYNAIEYAMQLLKHDVCEFYVLHTYSVPIVSAGSMLDSYSALVMQDIAKKTADEKLEALENRVVEKFDNDNHTITTVASLNILVDEMLNMVKEHNIDYVVMGTKGASGAKEIFIGTNTMYAIKKLKCPLLAVPSEFKYEPLTEILFPTDYKLDSKNQYLSMLRELCDSNNSRIHFLNAYYGTPLTEEQKETQGFLDAFFIDNAHIFELTEETDIVSAVEKFQAKKKINFVVMIHNKHTFFENLLFKPVINQIVYHTNVPFLVIPSAEKQTQ